MELRLYTLIGAKVTTRFELEEYYDLDDALKLCALHQMMTDIEAAQADELKNKINKK
jgi:hypothetical protein